MVWQLRQNTTGNSGNRGRPHGPLGSRHAAGGGGGSRGGGGGGGGGGEGGSVGGSHRTTLLPRGRRLNGHYSTVTAIDVCGESGIVVTGTNELYMYMCAATSLEIVCRAACASVMLCVQGLFLISFLYIICGLCHFVFSFLLLPHTSFLPFCVLFPRPRVVHESVFNPPIDGGGGFSRRRHVRWIREIPQSSKFNRFFWR